MIKKEGQGTEQKLDTLICVYSDLWPSHVGPIITIFYCDHAD